MSRDPFDMQIEQLRSQVAELRSKMDELATGQQWPEKGRHTMEEAKKKALGMGHHMTEQKGIAIPLGTLLLTFLAVMAVMTMFPEFGTRATETFRKWWNHYFGKGYGRH